MANNTRVNYWIDVGLVITFIISLVTGIIKWPGFFRITGIRPVSLPMFEIGFVHDWSGLIMGLLVLAHVILHFNWMISMTKGLFRRKKGDGK